MHLVVGAFHRAHQAVYSDAAIERLGGDWGVCGISLRRPDVRDALARNDNLYTLAIKSGAGMELRTIGALRRMLVAPEDPAAVSIEAGGGVAAVFRRRGAAFRGSSRGARRPCGARTGRSCR